MRLIDADNLIFRCSYQGTCMASHEQCLKCSYYVIDAEDIADTPTAYDVEKVVEELEYELTLAEKQKEECVFKGMPYYDRTEGYIVATTNAIEIVKGGVDNAE